MSEVTLNGVAYRRTRSMPGTVQFDVMARILPLFASGFGELVPLYAKLKREGLSFSDNAMTHISEVLVPASRELQKMSNEDRRFLLNTCLGLVDRKNPTRDSWEPIWNTDAGASMFKDIDSDLMTMLRLCLYVLSETFDGFFPEGLLSFLGVVRG